MNKIIDEIDYEIEIEDEDDYEDEDEDDDTDYKIKGILNNSLSETINSINCETKIDECTIQSIPKQHGLDNSDQIIPTLYCQSKSFSSTDMLNVDYYEIIRNDVANCRSLNKYQMKYIKNYLNEGEKMELFYLFNRVLIMIEDTFKDE